jgi:HAD superfamily hydrolase (TIGR01549 family)
MNKITEIGDLVNYCSNTPSVSFDLFDTLIRRRFLRANEVHDTASAYALALTGRRRDSSPFDLTLLRYRISDAMKSFDGSGTQEPLIVEVWEKILQGFVTDAQDRARMAREVVAFELQVELANLALVEGAHDLLVKLKGAGKTIVAVTDMYFDKPTMEKILTKLGILQFLDHLYVSAESKLTKQTGDLFRLVLDDLRLDPAKVMHVGDNFRSDVTMANSAGLQAIHVEQEHLLQLERPDYGSRERIEVEVADVTKTHLFSVLLDCLDSRADHLYFLARDGCAINRFLSGWNSTLVDRFLTPPPRSDLYLNRILTCWGGVDFSGEWLVQSIGLAFWLNHGKATYQELCRCLGINTIPASLAETGLQSDRETLRIAKIFHDEGLEETVRDHILSARRRVIRHLDTIGFFKHRAAAFSDIGYSGTVMRDLNILFTTDLAREGDFTPPAMTLHLIATNENYVQNRSRAFPFVRFSNNVVLPASELPGELKDSFAWLEFFFKHPTLQPILGLIEQDGRTMPQLRHEGPPLQPMPTDRVIDLAPARDEDIVLLWMAAVDFKGPLIQPIINRFANPNHDLVDQMSDEVFEQHSINGSRRSILLRIPGARPEAIAVAARDGDYWIAGSIIASQGNAPALETTDEVKTRAGNQHKPGMVRRLSKLIGLSNSPKALPPIDSSGSFDPTFYRSFYPDLRRFATDETLWAHYFSHGQKERRFGNHLALVAQLEAECGEVPVDFDGWNYLRRNPDLAATVENPERALDHYMRHGRREGRQFSHDDARLVPQFEMLVESGTIVLDEQERRQHASGKTAMDLFLRRYRLPAGAWIDAIDLSEFRVVHQSWCGPVATRAAAIVALLERGIERTPALSLNWMFDVEFYRRQARLPPSLSDGEVYFHMLAKGASQGLAPSEPTALKRLWGHAEFPECFDWRKFLATLSRKQDDPDRVEILREFIELPGLERLRFVSGAGSSLFVSFLANRAWRLAGRHDEARELFGKALALGASPGQINHMLGDLLLDTGNRAEALRQFRKAAQVDSADLWSHYHLARMLIEDGDHLSALAELAKCRERWQERAPWRRLHHRAMQLRTLAVLRLIRSAPPGPLDLSAFDELMHDVAETLPRRTQGSSHGGGAVVLTMRPASAARRDRIPASAITVYDMLSVEQEDYLAAVLAHETVIFHELPFTYDVLRAIALARSLGKRTVAWLGDLADWQGLGLARCIWSEHGDSTSPFGLGQCPELILPARACEFAVATLAGCIPLLQEIAPDVPHELVAVAPDAPQGAPGSTRKVLMVPVSTASSADVSALARALRDAARTDARLHFLIDARLAKQPELDQIFGRCSLLAPDIDLPALAEVIATADVVVQLLGNTSHQYAAWAEAGARNVPTIVVRETPSLPAAGGKKRSAEPSLPDWPAGLPKPILPAELASVLASPDGGSIFRVSIGNTPAVPASGYVPVRRRKRILFANVFFAPQTIGGATRVLKDNIDYLLDHHSDEFELAVVTTDEQNDHTGEWRADTYRGVAVFRIATPQEMNMDWRPINLQSGARFAAVLDFFQPDLVHIHCLQRLSVTIAEICQDRTLPHFVTLHDGWWISDFPFLVNEEGTFTPAMADFTAQERLGNITADTSWRRARRLRGALKGATRRLSVSKSFAKLYEACGIACETIENGTSRIDPLRRCAGVGDRVQLCHVGGLEHHKGAYMIEAALRNESYKNIHLTIVDLARGPNDETHTSWGTTPVTITGKMSTTELARFYARMHVLLAPSTWPESYGLVTREALAHGLWVVASDLGAIGEPVEQGRNGFVVSVADTAELIAVLATIDGEPATYRRSPLTPTVQRLADDQSRELVALYREYTGVSDTAGKSSGTRVAATAR